MGLEFFYLLVNYDGKFWNTDEFLLELMNESVAMLNILLHICPLYLVLNK